MNGPASQRIAAIFIEESTMWIDPETGWPRTKRYEVRIAKSAYGLPSVRVFKDGKPLGKGHLIEQQHDGKVRRCDFIDEKVIRELNIMLDHEGRFAGFDLSKAKPAPKKKSNPAAAKVDEWLRAELEGGRRKAAEIHAESKRAGFTESQLRTARKRLGVNVERRGFGGEGVWWWSLPVSINEHSHE